MIKITEKKIFQISACRIDKELIQKIADLLKNFNPHYSLTSPIRDIESDDATLFVGTEWPSPVSTINISVRDESQSIDIEINLKQETESKVSVWGKDTIWVNGVAEKLDSIFKSKRVKYYTFAEHWSLRAILSISIISIAIWILNHRLWPSTAPIVKNLSETSFFAVLLMVFIWLAYPLYGLLNWLFPRFGFEGSIKGKIRKLLCAIVVFLVGWFATELALPWLFT